MEDENDKASSGSVFEKIKSEVLRKFAGKSDLEVRAKILAFLIKDDIMKDLSTQSNLNAAILESILIGVILTCYIDCFESIEKSVGQLGIEAVKASIRSQNEHDMTILVEHWLIKHFSMGQTDAGDRETQQENDDKGKMSHVSNPEEIMYG